MMEYMEDQTEFSNYQQSTVPTIDWKLNRNNSQLMMVGNDTYKTIPLLKTNLALLRTYKKNSEDLENYDLVNSTFEYKYLRNKEDKRVNHLPWSRLIKGLAGILLAMVIFTFGLAHAYNKVSAVKERDTSLSQPEIGHENGVTNHSIIQYHRIEPAVVSKKRVVKVPKKQSFAPPKLPNIGEKFKPDF